MHTQDLGLHFLANTPPNILVVGDCVLDHYHHGTAERISPEAPIPVVHISHSHTKLGGAANVALNVKALGAQVQFLSMMGDDPWGQCGLKLLQEAGIETHGVHLSAARCTTLKQRVVAMQQQILRFDQEVCTPLNPDEHQVMTDHLQQALRDVDLIIVSDYNKGLLTETFLAQLIAAAKQRQLPVLVDPKGKDYHKYQGSHLLSPNRHEAEMVLGCTLSTQQDIEAALHTMQQRFQLDHALITLSEQGVAFLDDDGVHHVPTAQVPVFDVTGAGDTFLATLGFFLAQQYRLLDACQWANHAASHAVRHVGNHAVTLADLFLSYSQQHVAHKIITIGPLANMRHHMQGKVVFTNGCFDVLHRGHISYLKAARAMGDLLIVGVNSDASIQRLKGSKRPINPLEDRLAMLAALSFVDVLVVFDADTPIEVIQALQPDLLVKGGDYQPTDIVGHDIVKETRVIPFVEGYSSTRIINRMETTS